MWKRKKVEMQNEVRAVRDALYGIVEVQTVYHTRKDIFIKASPYLTIDDWREVISSRLSALGHVVEFDQLDPSLPAGPVVLHIRKMGQAAEERVPWTNIILFLLTVITTLFVGTLMNQVNPVRHPHLIYKGASFAVPLLLILIFHEFGHYLVSKKAGIKVSLPYFIPGPTLFGTFGAVIRSKSPFKSRRDLLGVGAAGPIAGFIVSVIVLIGGLAHSQTVDASSLDMQISGHSVTFVVREFSGSVLIVGQSLVFKFLAWFSLAHVAQGHIVQLSPAAFAGWAGILVTMLNLLPIGQLDGGHIMYALLGRNQRKVALVATFALIPLGYFLWFGWFVWVVLVLLIKVGHPPTLDDQVSLDAKRKVIGWLAMLIFILSFTPVPIK
ncbi:MAG: site-2 protease family protein [Candidatus Zixiibacteriota bacterium]|nr:MAG: site-2 protease family protein [candidate division Zixibacteria bacterium]